MGSSTAELTSEVRSRHTARQNDLLDAFASYHFWGYLAWHDIRIRYRHSRLGPLWITLSTAIFCITIAVVYSTIFKTAVTEMLPFVAIGSVVWSFISGVIGEMPNLFVANSAYLKNMRINPIVIQMRALCRELIALAHHLLIVIGIYLYFGIWPGWVGLLAIPGLILVLLNLLAVGITLSLVGARFRDVTPITQSFLLIAFFVTPIFWLPRMVPDDSWILMANPFYHFIDLVRSPLLGSTPSPVSWYGALVVLGVSSIIATVAYRIGRKRVAFWV
jgi:ABC-type polysaccharide/polyol phosphate export permease